MTARDVFRSNLDLKNYWAAISHSDRFRSVLTVARSELMDRSDLTADQIKGAKFFEEILLTVADDPALPAPWPNVGLQHALDEPRPKIAGKKKTEKPKV